MEKEQGQIFNELDFTLAKYGYTKPQDIFRLLNDYQNYRLDGIEKANNERYRTALFRSLDYTDKDFLKKWRRSKNKEKLVRNLVNTFVLQVHALEHKDLWGDYSFMYSEIVKFKDKLLSNKPWYLRVIPESSWLIEHLEDLSNG